MPDATPRVDQPPDEASERRYRIGLCGALSKGWTGDKARAAAGKMQRLPRDEAHGVVLDRGAAFRSAAWRQYTSAYTLALYVLGFGFLPVLYVFEEWAELKTLLTLLDVERMMIGRKIIPLWRSAPPQPISAASRSSTSGSLASTSAAATSTIR